MLNIWKDQYEIPIFNYYESFKDLKYMLKEPQKLNKTKYIYLADKLTDLQEWFAKQVNESLYKNKLKTSVRITNLENKVFVLETLKGSADSLQQFRKFSNVIEDLSKFKNVLSTNKVAFIDDIGMFLKTINRQIATKKAEIEYIKNEIKRTERVSDNYNYMKDAMICSKNLGFKVDVKSTTLAEWAEIIKLQEDAK